VKGSEPNPEPALVELAARHGLAVDADSVGLEEAGLDQHRATAAAELEGRDG